MTRIAAVVIAAGVCFAADWLQFRGPNGSGVGNAERLPIKFGPRQNVVWKTSIPFGHSSPVIAGDLIFLTAVEDGVRANVGSEKDKFSDRGKLYTLAIDRRTGKIVWRRGAPRQRTDQYQTNNSPATPSAVSDGVNVYVFFQDFGFLSYTAGGAERWRLEVAPFNNMNGAGSSPILYRDLLILVCDQDSGSYMLAVDKNTGRVRWKILRPEATRSYITPAVFEPKDGPAELILPGPYQITSYYAATGEKAWWVRGFSWHPKTVPVIDGDVIYAGAAESGGDSETRQQLPTFAELTAGHDRNHDGKLVVAEFPDDPKMQKLLPNIDLNTDGFVDETEWNFYLAKMASRNTLIAIRHGGRGDLTGTNVIWSVPKFLPRCTSPLLYQGVLYMVKEGGILTAVDPKTGNILKQARLTGALDDYYASPVGAAGMVFLLSQQGKATVVKAGADWEILALNDLEEETYATPAILDDKLYIRTRGTLYCFAVR